MGALTLKSTPFVIRNWDTTKNESIDPTDGFGSPTRVYIINNQVVLIEPEYNLYTTSTWITDKARQFFDSIFDVFSKSTEKNHFTLSQSSWISITKKLAQVVYIQDHWNSKQKNKTEFFTLVFENLSIEILSFLVALAQNYSFIKLKKAESFNFNNDLESNFQLNITSNNKTKLSNSEICLLISTNPRYEGYFLNLSLRQRFFKGSFKCLILGSLINLTFPVVFLGSNISTIKTISEGNNLVCQTLKSSKNLITVYNNELLKRLDKNSVIETLKILKYSSIFYKTWNNLTTFSSTLTETGAQSISKFLTLTKTDLTFFGVLYFLNINTRNITNLKRISEFKLLNFNLDNKNLTKLSKLLLDQSHEIGPNFNFFNKKFLLPKKDTKYAYLPVSTFYENEETYINTEGLVKRTVKIIFRKKTKNNWQTLRKIFQNFNTSLFLTNNNNLIFFNSKNINLFKNYIYFNYQATQSLSNLNFYLPIKTNSFNIINQNFKKNKIKLVYTKLKYWLDDFYNGGKDDYSQYSLTLTNCSKILRTKLTNFF